MAETPIVSLRLSNRPESVAVVQRALSGVAAELGLDALESNDLNTAVTEVCNNVVLHAYDGQEGQLEVEVHALAGALDVVVRDRGIGIRPHVGERTQPHTGLGMPIVHALTQRLLFSKLAGGGTEVRMQFTTPDAAVLEPLADDATPDPESVRAGAGEHAIALALAPSSVSHAVGLIADALAAGARDSIGERRLHLTVEVQGEKLELRVGPLPVGAAARLFDAVLSTRASRLLTERLPENCDAASRDSDELLALRLLERR
jgi:serine/threonine-protein kinase RsbW